MGLLQKLGARQNHVPKNRKTQKLYRFSEGEMNWFQFSFENTLKKALNKLFSKFGWPMMMESCWNRVPTLAALGWNREKRENSTIISEGGNRRNQIYLQKHAKRCYEKAVEQIWLTYNDGRLRKLCTEVGYVGVGCWRWESAEAEHETMYGSKWQSSQVHWFCTRGNFTTL